MAYDGIYDELCSLLIVVSTALALNYCDVVSTVRENQSLLMTSAVWVSCNCRLHQDLGSRSRPRDSGSPAESAPSAQSLACVLNVMCDTLKSSCKYEVPVH